MEAPALRVHAACTPVIIRPSAIIIVLFYYKRACHGCLGVDVRLSIRTTRRRSAWPPYRSRCALVRTCMRMVRAHQHRPSLDPHFKNWFPCLKSFFCSAPHFPLRLYMDTPQGSIITASRRNRYRFVIDTDYGVFYLKATSCELPRHSRRVQSLETPGWFHRNESALRTR